MNNCVFCGGILNREIGVVECKSCSRMWSEDVFNEECLLKHLEIERIKQIIDELAEDDGYINAKDLLKRL